MKIALEIIGGIIAGIIITLVVLRLLYRWAENRAFRGFWMPCLVGMLSLVILTPGCALFSKPGVPATKISFNPKTEALSVSSPKDVTIDSVSITQSNGTFALTVTGYKSTNNAALVGIVVNAQAQIASNAASTINSLAGMAAQAVGKIP